MNNTNSGLKKFTVEGKGEFKSYERTNTRKQCRHCERSHHE